MSSVVIKYTEDHFAPIDALNWEQVVDLLHAGYDPRIRKSESDAEDEIASGGRGDALAFFESFPYLVHRLRTRKDDPIDVTDEGPAKPHTGHSNIHVNLDAALRAYASTFDTTNTSAKAEAWLQVEMCFSMNDFTSKKNEMAICTAVYESLFHFFETSSNVGQEKPALILVRAIKEMPFSDQGTFGYLGKRGNRAIKASDHSPQIWTSDWTGKLDAKHKEKKTKRAIGAMLGMAKHATQ